MEVGGPVWVYWRPQFSLSGYYVGEGAQKEVKSDHPIALMLAFANGSCTLPHWMLCHIPRLRKGCLSSQNCLLLIGCTPKGACGITAF